MIFNIEGNKTLRCPHAEWRDGVGVVAGVIYLLIRELQFKPT